MINSYKILHSFPLSIQTKIVIVVSECLRKPIERQREMNKVEFKDNH